MRKKTTASTKKKKASPSKRSVKSKTTGKMSAKSASPAKKRAASSKRKSVAKKTTSKAKMMSKSKATKKTAAKKSPLMKTAAKKTAQSKKMAQRAKAPRKTAKKSTTHTMKLDPRKVNAEIVEIIEEQKTPNGVPAPEDALLQTNMPHHGIPYKPENYVSQHAMNKKAENARGLKKPRGTSTITFASPGHGRGSSNSDS